ncbi:MAG: hypothetical protein FWC91_00280 [Defluviitaleaceae bacterium]|nr:hypothetical protein [Defluviitaleaceae bacterium]
MFAVVFDRVVFSMLIILVLSAVMLFFRYKGSRNRYRLRDQFLEEDMEANSTRGREVEKVYYYSPNLTSLPMRDDAEGNVKKKQDRVQQVAQQTMLRFPRKLTNIELKTEYGVANLEKITGYEANYHRYVSALVEWAEALLEQESEQEFKQEQEEQKQKDAIKILEHTVELDSEFRKTYMYLADYYASIANYDGINYLLDQIPERFTDEGIRQQLVQYLMDKKDQA